MKKMKMNRKKGFTLVELIVVFALTGLFMVAAATAIMGAMKVYGRMNDLTKAEVVADTLMETIVGEVSAAQNKEADVGTAGVVCQITKGQAFDKLNFVDKHGNQVELSVPESGRLKLEYNKTGGGELGEWQYGENTYMSNRITKLQFEQIEDKNVIKATLRLQNVKSGYDYEITRMIKCYNITNPDATIRGV